MADDMDIAVIEIEATQALNKRAKGDKTYHLIASFREGDNPTKSQLADIEQSLCDALGLGDHQRLSAVHGDTDHLHMHIAINKVHPVSHKLVTPYRDFYHLQAACRELEQRHDLQVDNGVADAERISAQARDFEAQQGIESFQGWAKGEPSSRLNALLERPAPSWSDVHRALAEYGLEITPRGAGLVIRDQGDNRLAIRASQLGRGFAKAALEKRLGQFVPADDDLTTAVPVQRYEPKPLARSTRQTLWKDFERQRHQRVADRRTASKALSTEATKAFGELRARFARRRQVIKQRRDIRGSEKRAEYALLRMERVREQMALRQAFRARRSALVDDHPVESWLQYLQREASAGNIEAVAALRRSEQRRTDQPNAGYLSGHAASEQPTLYSSMQYRVHRNGDVTYYVDGRTITDEGKRIRLGEAFSDQTLETALRLARNQFGARLTLKGTDAFKQAAAAAAGRLGMDVVFTDAALEQEKLSHVKTAQRRDPVQAFIDQRNAVREWVEDVLPHRRYDTADAGEAVYRGLRSTQGGPKVALLEKDGVMLVRPVDDKAANDLRRQRIGTLLSMDSTAVRRTDRERD